MKEAVRICGLGTRTPEETTLEALIALGECREVFCRVEDPRTFRWLASHGLKPKRPKDAKTVVAAARKKGGPVGLAVWGHPQFDSAFARETQSALRAAAIPYRIYGAISPAGSAFARSVSFLGGDYGYQGMQCYALDTLLSDPAAATDRLPLIVSSERSSRERWSSLFALLRSRYPAGHETRVYHLGGDEEETVAVDALSARDFTGAVILVPPKSGAPARPHAVAG